MKEYKQLGAYGILIEDNKILLIKKFGGPYDGKFDLPGGTIEFGERPAEALKRELLEEVGIVIINQTLFDTDSVKFLWNYKNDVVVNVHHIGVFYIIDKYNNDIKKEVLVDEVNDDSLGAEFYNINDLRKSELSAIAVMILEKLGYKIDD